MYATEHQAAILRSAVAAIKAHPETFDMETWVKRPSAGQDCGTVCCLAGHIVRDAIDSNEWDRVVRFHEGRGKSQCDIEPIPVIAQKLLGCVNTDALFLSNEWPYQFRPSVNCTCDYDEDECFCDLSNPTPDQLEARVNHWIETGE